MGDTASKWSGAIEVLVSQIEENPWNPNAMSEDMFHKLLAEIKDTGFDEPIIVVPHPDKPNMYRVINGEHRLKAVQVLEWTHVPVVVKHGLTEADQKTMTVRRNLLHGDLDRAKFTDLVNDVINNHGMQRIDVPDRMGFLNEKDFTSNLVTEKIKQAKDMSDQAKQATTMVDNTSFLLNEIFTKFGCFPPGTSVEGKDGPVPIENIKVGDLVVTADGVCEPVRRLFKREFRGELVEIKLRLDRTPIRMTPNHPVFIVRPKRKNARSVLLSKELEIHKVSADNLQLGDYVMLPKYKETSGSPYIEVRSAISWTRDTVCLIAECGNTVRAKGYCQGHYQRFHRTGDAAQTRVKTGIKRLSVCSEEGCGLSVAAVGLCARHYAADSGKFEKINGKFFVDEDLAFFIGVYVAEGHKDATKVRFSLGFHETALAERLLSIAFSVFGLAGRQYEDPDKGSRYVMIASPALSAWMEKNCGRGALEKQLPPGSSRWPDRLLQALVNGVQAGDGARAFDGKGGSVGVISERLVRQLRRALLKLGKISTIGWVHPRGNRHTLHKVEWLDAPKLRSARWHQDYLAVRIKRITRVPYEGAVHNIEVRRDHTYQVQGMAVGNSTVPNGFLFFMHKSKMHLMVQMDKDMEETMGLLVAHVKASGQNINDVITKALVGTLAAPAVAGPAQGPEDVKY